MKLTGKRLEREGSWRGPRLIACWYDFSGTFETRGKNIGSLREAVEHFFEQCRFFDLSCSIVYIPYQDVPESIKQLPVTFKRPAQRWNRFFPYFIHAMMKEREEPLLYCHVDTEIRKKPPLSIFQGSVRVSEGKSLVIAKLGRRKTHILGAPVYINNCSKGKHFLKRWREKCETSHNSKRTEHEFLQETFKEKRDDREIAKFGVVMCSRDINDDPYLYC